MELNLNSRRRFINKCLSARSLFFAATIFINSCNAKESSDRETNNKKQSTSKDPCNDMSVLNIAELEKRQKFGYEKKSTYPERFCGNCDLHIPPVSEKDCGGCLLFKGPVNFDRYCIQYAAKI